MKLRIILTNSELQNCMRLCNILKIKPKNAEGKWGSIHNNDLFVEERCFLDLTSILITIIPKFENLMNFVKILFPVTKEAGTAFYEKWFKDANISDLENRGENYDEISNEIEQSVVQAAPTNEQITKEEIKSEDKTKPKENIQHPKHQDKKNNSNKKK